MRKLVAFVQVSLDGCFADAKGDFSWAHKDPQDAEWNAFVANNASGGGMLVFGRKTYELMASYWPTPVAAKNDPVVAERMNSMPKVVFSRTLKQASWSNTRIAQDSPGTEIRKLKAEAGPDMATLGSGSIVSQFAQEGVIDEYQIVVNPLVIGNGKALFEGVTQKLKLRLLETRPFANGSVLLRYGPTT